MENKVKILCIMQLPPPIHGASIMNSIVADSSVLKEVFIIDILATNYIRTIDEVGRNNYKKIWKLFIYLFRLFYKLLFRRPNLVYFTIVPYGTSFFRDTLFVFIIKLFRVKLVYHLHGKGAKEYYKKYKWIYDFAYKNVSVICLAEKLIDDIPFYKGKPFIVPNGIPKINFQQKQDGKRKNHIIQMLYLSNFIKSKGVLELLQAVSIVKEQSTNFKVQLIGQYSAEISESYLKQYIKENHIGDYVELIGPVYGNKKEIYFMNADIFVFPTSYKNEAFPLVLLEAMQYELPVISTHEGGIPDEVINGETGFLVSPKSIEELADKILVLLKDEKLRAQMGKKGYDRFKEKFTVSIFENNIKNVFLKILNE